MKTMWLWATQIIYVKCSNNLPSGAKMRQLTNQMWIPRSLAWFSDGWADDLEPSENQAMRSSPDLLGKEVKAKSSPRLPGKHKLVNIRWLFPLLPPPCPGWGVGVRGVQMTGAYTVRVTGRTQQLFPPYKSSSPNFRFWCYILTLCSSTYFFTCLFDF